MHFQLLVVLALTGGALAGGHKFCSQGDSDIVMKQWSSLYNGDTSGKTKVMIGRQIFDSLFDLAPGAVGLFTRVNVDDRDSGEFSAHIMRVIGGLDIAINSLTDQCTLSSIADHLLAQHLVRNGVTKGHFRMMGEVLMTSLAQLVEDFNPDIWQNCLVPILNAISNDLPQ